MKKEENILADDLDHILLNTKDILEEFRGARVFVTGGTGFFGTWLLEAFAWANDKLDLDLSAVVLSRSPEKFWDKAPHLASHDHFEFITGDVQDFTFPAGKFSHVFHLATEASDDLNRRNPVKMFDVIVQGTRHTLDFAIAAGAAKFLLASSGAVYGKQPPQIKHVPEDYAGAPDPLNPLSAYGEGKRAAELLCSLYSQQTGLQVKIARCFAFVGPYLPLDTHFAIGNFILNALRGEQIVIKGDGTPLRSYLYASDLVIWLLTIMARGKNCYPYNVGAEAEISIKDLAETVVNCLYSPCSIEIREKKPLTELPEVYVPRTVRGTQELGLQQLVDLHKSIIKTAKFYQ